MCVSTIHNHRLYFETLAFREAKLMEKGNQRSFLCCCSKAYFISNFKDFNTVAPKLALA